VIVENNLQSKIVNKVKVLHSCQWAHTLNELDEKLDSELAGELPMDSERRMKYYKRTIN